MSTTRIFILAIALLLSVNVEAQKKYDSLAILIIDRMSHVVGDLRSCSFKVNVIYDDDDGDKILGEYEVYMSGRDKMLVNAFTSSGHRQYIYKGTQLACYSFDEHNYAVISTPPTTLQMIDSLGTHFGIEFPAADFFYPAFTDDLKEDSEFIKYMNTVRVPNAEYFHVLASSTYRDIHIWINNDAFNLPSRLAITYKRPKGNHYFASFTDWQLNPDLPAAMFDFLPPPGSAKVRLVSKSER